MYEHRAHEVSADDREQDEPERVTNDVAGMTGPCGRGSVTLLDDGEDTR